MSLAISRLERRKNPFVSKVIWACSRYVLLDFEVDAVGLIAWVRRSRRWP